VFDVSQFNVALDMFKAMASIGRWVQRRDSVNGGIDFRSRSNPSRECLYIGANET
jgi:hypothetical protein